MKAAPFLAAALAAAAFAAGRWSAPGRTEPGAPPGAQRQVVAAREVCAPQELGGTQAILDEIAGLRAEVRAARPTVAGEAKEAPEPQAPTAEQVAMGSEGARIVDTAIRAGRWTQEDVQAFRLRRGGMTSGQLEEVVGRLFNALNDGTLRIEFRGSPI